MTEYKLGTLPLNQVKTINETATSPGSDPSEAYKFDVNDTYAFYFSGGNLNLALTDVSVNDTFVMDLYKDGDKGGTYSELDIFVQHSQAANVRTDNPRSAFLVNGDRSIYMSNLEAGNYVVFVHYNIPNDGSASYKFQASNTTQESNILAVTQDLNSVPGLNTTFSNLHLNDQHTSDIYKFRVAAGQHVDVSLTESTGKAQMNLIDDVAKDHIDTNYQEIVNHTVGSSQTKTLTVDSGEHYLQVFGVPGQDLATTVKFGIPY